MGKVVVQVIKTQAETMRGERSSKATYISAVEIWRKDEEKAG